MTPDNDKTIRGIFTPIQVGVNEFPDRRNYRESFEKTFKLGNKLKFRNIFISVNEKSHILRDNVYVNEEEYLMGLERLFPESKVVFDFIKYQTFGYAIDVNGNYNCCDRCGKKLHALNCNHHYGLCEDCEYDMERLPEFDIRG